jgi:Peptidase family M1 domain
VTKVLFDGRRLGIVALLCVALLGASVAASAEIPQGKPAQALYLQLAQVGLDPARVYKVRGASLDRSAVHITLEDGTIGFTQDVMGRITGAFFEGDGEILLTPPNDVERKSMSLFTGMAILEEHFATAYFRFNDDAESELRPDLRVGDNKQEFVERWGASARNLAQGDAMRLLMSFSRLLPSASEASTVKDNATLPGSAKDRFLHARLQGTKLGVFDVYFDSTAPEEVQAGQPKAAGNGALFYDVWTSFSPATRSSRSSEGAVQQLETEAVHQDWIAVQRYSIDTEVTPPKQIHAQARVQLEVKEGGARALLFELSRFLQIESVQMNGQPVEFIHNPAIEGTQLSRQGNDIVAVILPELARAGQSIDLQFAYGGEVLAEAGSGLLYVGARGTWYPNRGMAMANFDLQFEYPRDWTLVATGKPTPVSDPSGTTKANGKLTARWVSERPLPLAGFNLGKYRLATAQAGNVTVETYAAQGVEKTFPGAKLQVIEPDPADPVSRSPQVIVPHRPSPAQNEASVGEAAARAIQYYAERFGPYPYSRLMLTQMPGRESQGWPGLVFLSSYAFLTDEERAEMHFEPFRTLLQQIIPAHETAHQWWGDLVTWSTYRDQWFSEGLANYCALMMLQDKDPAGFRQIMEKYRQDLIAEAADSESTTGPGPVTLGARLFSSRFPEGYEAISYGRGTWLFHMLRTMLRDAENGSGRKQFGAGSRDEPFVRALRKVREKYEGKSITTRELFEVFAEELPPSLRYEGKSSLDWFMDGWVNGTALPKLEAKGVKFSPKGAGLVVTGTIVQKNAPEDLVTSVPVYGVTQGKSMVLLGRVFADGQESSFRVSAPAGTHKIVLDPNETVLTNVK